MYNNKIIEQEFKVDFKFKLFFTSDMFDCENKILVDSICQKSVGISKAILVLDKGVIETQPLLKPKIYSYFEFYKSKIALCGEIFEIPGGEHSKNKKKYIQKILKNINKYKIDRHSYVICIGGGAVLDTVGFASAIAHRGVRLIRVPTTVLSQNDSGVGVKNGINYFGKKNFIGSFAAPVAVINDHTFLKTLEDRDWRSGISEAIKVALVKDFKFFEWIEKHITELNNRNIAVMSELIYRCSYLHIKHIQSFGDPFEQGSSRPLDFGHWAAHKLEQLSDYKIKHGEAVAIGISLDSTYSFLKGYLKEISLKRIINCILKLGFVIHSIKLDKEILEGLGEFREHLGGELTIMLLKGIGSGFDINEIDEDTVLKSIEYINQYDYAKKTSR